MATGLANKAMRMGRIRGESPPWNRPSQKCPTSNIFTAPKPHPCLYLFIIIIVFCVTQRLRLRLLDLIKKIKHGLACLTLHAVSDMVVDCIFVFIVFQFLVIHLKRLMEDPLLIYKLIIYGDNNLRGCFDRHHNKRTTMTTDASFARPRRRNTKYRLYRPITRVNVIWSIRVNYNRWCTKHINNYALFLF